MIHFYFMILTSLWVQYTWSIKITNILPTMEPFNKTHCKIFYETSFQDLPKVYVANLVHMKEDSSGVVRPLAFRIVDNFVKYPPCHSIENFILMVGITFDGEQETTASHPFNYDPANLRNVIKEHGCLNHSSHGIGAEEEMKKKDKFFDYCLKEMEIIQIEKDDIITVRATFFRKKTKGTNEIVPKFQIFNLKDLKDCSQKEIEMKNILYGIEENYIDSGITEKNLSYGVTTLVIIIVLIV